MTVHSTETPPGSGRSVIRQLPWPYSVVADPVTREVLEVLPLNFTAYALRGTHKDTGEKIETNHAGIMHPQVALVGYAARMHLLEDPQIQWLADVVFRPIMELCEIRNAWVPTHGADEGIVLASASSPIRPSLTACHLTHGVLHHQTWYGNDHWDPGRLDVQDIMEHLEGPATVGPGVAFPGRLVLGWGDSGPDVLSLQELLNKWFDAGLDTDGDYGAKTRLAVIAAQTEIGTNPDGYWGPESKHQFDRWQQALAEAIVNPPPAVPEPVPPSVVRPPIVETVDPPPTSPRPVVKPPHRGGPDLVLAKKVLKQARQELKDITRVIGDVEQIL